jgi:hypothetical protein
MWAVKVTISSWPGQRSSFSLPGHRRGRPGWLGTPDSGGCSSLFQQRYEFFCRQVGVTEDFAQQSWFDSPVIGDGYGEVTGFGLI